jgi:Cu(I)/Ag(I) efflux system membrane fusion protein
MTDSPTPPPRTRRFGAGTVIIVALLAAGLGVGGSALFHLRSAGTPAGSGERKILFYRNPMGKADTSPVPKKDEMGMDYIPVYADEAGGTASAGEKSGGERKILFYRNPMGTGDTSPVPKKDQMGMDYIPVYSDEVGGATPSVEGLATVTIDANRQQLIGLRTATVESGSVGGSWRTNGKVTVDETRVHHVNLKVGGYVTHTHAQFVGQSVKQGEPLFSMYSPELLAAQDEYLLAVRTSEQLRAGGAASTDGDDLIASARRKLDLWDVPESELKRIEQTGKPLKELTFYAPHAGVVTKRDALPGMRVNAGDMPIELADLSRVWVVADVYETELRHVKLGMPATLALKAYPNRTFRGRVTFIAPVLDPRTRTVAVRLEFPNATGELKPEMFGEVVLNGSSRAGLRIPTDAVVDSGTRKVVFVAVGEGRFQPRQVELGDSDGNHFEVVSGLSQGEQVVTRANFLIDSESRLRASLDAMINKTVGEAGGATPPATSSDASQAPPPPPQAAAGKGDGASQP